MSKKPVTTKAEAEQVVKDIRHPVERIEDMADLRMRALDETQIRLYEAWGSAGTIMAWPEGPGALQTGVADGYLNAPIVPLMFGHQDFLHHFTDVQLSAPMRIAVWSQPASQRALCAILFAAPVLWYCGVGPGGNLLRGFITRSLSRNAEMLGVPMVFFASAIPVAFCLILLHAFAGIASHAVPRAKGAARVAMQ